LTRLEFKKVDRDSREALGIFRLRYQVYCQEWGFEDPDDYPEGFEKDDFDEHSCHFLARVRKTRDIIGTARIILPSAKQFPIEKVFDLDESVIPADRGKLGEISRLAVSKNFRRRWLDTIIFGPENHNSDLPVSIPVKKERRQFENEIVAGLYQCIYHESKRVGLTHWYAVMGKGLHLLLMRWGLIFQQIGSEVDYHGLRAPYLGTIAQMYESVVRKSPRLLEKPPGWEE